MKFYVGCSGWNYDHWKGSFYPEDVTRKEWFGFYSGRFSSVEVNYSFYRWPSEKTLKRWKNDSPSGFIFTLKAPRMITHVKKLKDVGKWVDDFYELSSLLGRKMGCRLFQLPPNIHLNEHNVDKLRTFLGLLDKRRENAIEFRHPSWWTGKIYDLLEGKKVAFVTVSGLGMPDDVVVTGDTGYFRFHGGRYDKKYPGKELDRYADKILDSGCKKAYVYFNNDFNAYAPENAGYLEERLKKG